MEKAFLPEVEIYKYLNTFLSTIKTSIDADYNNNIIDKVFYGVTAVGRFNPKKEAKELFKKSEALNIRFGFNISTNELPAVHILLPDERLEIETIGFDGEYENDGEGIKTQSNSVIYQSEYNLLIIDKNADMAIFIYHVLKYMFLSYFEHLELDGFQTLKVYGRDLITQQGLVPQNIYSRSLILSFKHTRQFESVAIPEFGSSMIPHLPQIDVKTKVEDLDVDEELDPDTL